MGVGNRGMLAPFLGYLTVNKCRFSDAKRKPMGKSKRPVFLFDYIFICAFLRGESVKEEGTGIFEGMV